MWIRRIKLVCLLTGGLVGPIFLPSQGHAAWDWCQETLATGVEQFFERVLSSTSPALERLDARGEEFVPTPEFRQALRHEWGYTLARGVQQELTRTIQSSWETHGNLNQLEAEVFPVLIRWIAWYASKYPEDRPDSRILIASMRHLTQDQAPEETVEIFENNEAPAYRKLIMLQWDNWIQNILSKEESYLWPDRDIEKEAERVMVLETKATPLLQEHDPNAAQRLLEDIETIKATQGELKAVLDGLR